MSANTILVMYLLRQYSILSTFRSQSAINIMSAKMFCPTVTHFSTPVTTLKGVQSFNLVVEENCYVCLSRDCLFSNIPFVLTCVIHSKYASYKWDDIWKKQDVFEEMFKLICFPIVRYQQGQRIKELPKRIWWEPRELKLPNNTPTLMFN